MIGSHIYNQEDSSSDGRARYICNPSVLFDELHAFWFVEFLQQLCTSFADSIHRNVPGHPIAIVIDNSPGYVGIAPAVQQWLTDLGPDKGKFLTVTSLDVQDLISCGHAVENLHSLYSSKWTVSRKFCAGSLEHRRSRPILSTLPPLSNPFSCVYLNLLEDYHRLQRSQ